MAITPLPGGTVTFLFTDIEGSTRLWEQHPAARPAALACHDALLRTALEPTSRWTRMSSLRRRTAARQRGGGPVVVQNLLAIGHEPSPEHWCRGRRRRRRLGRQMVY